MRARAVSRFYVAIPISNVLMGVVAGSLLKLNGKMGLKGWQWLFVVEALPALVMGAVVLFILPEGPESAAWLEPEERMWLLRRLESEAPLGAKSLTGLFHALRDPRVLLFGIYFFLMLGLTYAFTFAAPTIFVGLTHWSAGRVGFVLAGIALLGAVSMIVVSHLSDVTGRRLAFVVPLTLTTGIAFLISALARGPHTAWIS